VDLKEMQIQKMVIGKEWNIGVHWTW